MRLLSLVTVVGFLMAVAAAASVQKPLTDDELHDKVIARLAADRDVKGGGIEVEVQNGVVTLKGKVREEAQKVKAEEVEVGQVDARKVVKHVVHR
jgi:osmotically-inducible protein OsmY